MTTIPKDLGSPFDRTDPVQLAEFEGFGTDAPNTRGIIAAAQLSTSHAVLLTLTGPLPGEHANRVRAAKLFSEPFLATIAATGGEAGANFPTPDPVVDETDANFMRTGRARTVNISRRAIPGLLITLEFGVLPGRTTGTLPPTVGRPPPFGCARALLFTP